VACKPRCVKRILILAHQYSFENTLPASKNKTRYRKSFSCALFFSRTSISQSSGDVLGFFTPFPDKTSLRLVVFSKWTIQMEEVARFSVFHVFLEEKHEFPTLERLQPLLALIEEGYRSREASRDKARYTRFAPSTWGF
jgi:hypothetical protein